jgi:lysophospholipase L1-like esterase
MIPLARPHQATRGKKFVAQRVVLWLIALLMAGPAVAATVCPAPQETLRMRLPHLQTALTTQEEGIIVAFGSSSTRGVMASDVAHSYPAILQAALGSGLQADHVAVINRGIGGQDAPEELARMQADVIAMRPQLVIWQVGANGALRDADPAEFGRLVTAGVTRLQAAGIDVILMDNQRSMRILASPDHTALEATLAGVAQETGANLFSRGQLMDGWSNQGIPLTKFLARDGIHHNDLGYLCVARALAEQIVAALHAPVAVTASR